MAAYPAQRVRITPLARDGTFVVEGAATSDPRSPQWRLHVPDRGAVVRGPTGQSIARVYVLEAPDARLRREAEFATAVTGGVIVVVLLAAALSMVIVAALATRIVRPVKELTSLALKFGAGDLRARSRAVAPDEIGQLARSFDEMADRLAHAEQVRRTMLTDVAHELRTPLTNVRCQLEAVQDGLLPATTETIGSLNDEILSLMQVIDDLQGSRAYGQVVSTCTSNDQTSPSSCSPLCARASGPRAVDHGPRFGAARGSGGSEALSRIVRNLIANAVAALPPPRSCHGVGGGRRTHVEIRVVDDGPGVPPAPAASFHRYYRVSDRKLARAQPALGSRS